MVVKDSSDRVQAVRGGLVGGLAGGVALGIFLAVSSFATGRDVWSAAKGAALPFFGFERVSQPGFDAGPVVVGVLAHFAVSIGWALVFATLAYGLSKSATVLFGVAWGVVVWLGMYYVVLPLVGGGVIAENTPVGNAILEHALYGLFVGLGLLPFQRVIGLPIEPPPIDEPRIPIS
jgi:uncharacterized protein DUF6789